MKVRLILGVEVPSVTSGEDGARRGSLAPFWVTEADSILEALAKLHLELGALGHVRLPETVEVPWMPEVVTPVARPECPPNKAERQGDVPAVSSGPQE